MAGCLSLQVGAVAYSPLAAYATRRALQRTGGYRHGLVAETTEIVDVAVVLTAGDSSSKPEGCGVSLPSRSVVHHHYGTQGCLMQSYFLAPHVYSCVTDDHVVLLDLERDKYVGVAREQVSALAGSVKGWPLSGSVPPELHPRAGRPIVVRSRVFAKMLAAGMLTTDPTIGKEASQLRMAGWCVAALIEPDLE